MPRAPCLGPGPSSIATPHALRCATTSSGVLAVRKHRSSLPAVSWSAVNHSILSAPFGRTLIFWLPNTSEVRGALPSPGSNTLTSMPRMLRYHSAERATSVTLITRWSMALILTGMAHPFVAAGAHWPQLALFVTTPGIVKTTTTRSGEMHDLAPYRDRFDRPGQLGHRHEAQRGGAGLSDPAGALRGRFSTGRRHR